MFFDQTLLNLGLNISDTFGTPGQYLINTSPLWLPALLFFVFATVWLKYKRVEFVIKQGGILLEIRIPKEMLKTPLAMEIFLTSLHQAGKGNILSTFLDGKLRPWFSLELVSINGQVHFFIWTHKKFRKPIEAQLYAQYPGVEVVEVDDYAKEVHLDPEKISLWGTTFKLTKDDIYPIKTYVDYGLDKEQEDEYKTDPITSVIEYLGSIKRGEQVWIQILIQAHRAESFKDDAKISGKKDWKHAAKAEIKEKIAELKSDDKSRPPSEGEKMVISALERSQEKFAFETCIRGFYIAEKDAFDPINIPSLIGSLRQYSSNTLNGFKLGKFTDFDHPWEDFLRIRRTAREKKLLEAYKLRSFFNLPYKHLMAKPFILTTEELATIFHLPGQVVLTPGLSKTQSRKSEAPPNLPI